MTEEKRQWIDAWIVQQELSNIDPEQHREPFRPHGLYEVSQREHDDTDDLLTFNNISAP